MSAAAAAAQPVAPVATKASGTIVIRHFVADAAMKCSGAPTCASVESKAGGWAAVTITFDGNTPEKDLQELEAKFRN
ncbi:MAG: hypothetical protein NUV60_03305 [Patescibacteria group bacterium]|nr:hypothetical protein [Patescibacteria group bacterium]